LAAANNLAAKGISFLLDAISQTRVNFTDTGARNPGAKGHFIAITFFMSIAARFYF